MFAGVCLAQAPALGVGGGRGRSRVVWALAAPLATAAPRGAKPRGGQWIRPSILLGPRVRPSAERARVVVCAAPPSSAGVFDRPADADLYMRFTDYYDRIQIPLTRGCSRFCPRQLLCHSALPFRALRRKTDPRRPLNWINTSFWHRRRGPVPKSAKYS